MLDVASTPHDRAEDDRRFLSDTIEHAVRIHLGTEKIVSVRSRRSEDFDGDDIIAVDVVINAKPSEFAPRSLSSLVRTLQAMLSEAGFSAFPMIRYMNQAENEARRK